MPKVSGNHHLEAGSMRKFQSVFLALMLSVGGGLHANAQTSSSALVNSTVMWLEEWAPLPKAQTKEASGAGDAVSRKAGSSSEVGALQPTPLDGLISRPTMLLAGLMVMGVIMKRRVGRRD
ncbi:MAG: hypothetical protein QM777_15200 [Pseudorhodoferax sp.]